MPTAKTRVICVGAVYIDTILTVPHFPLEDEKLRAKKLTKRRGGNTANTLEVLSQLFEHSKCDSDLRLCAVLPDKISPATKFIRESLPDVDVAGSSIFRNEEQEAASSYIIQNAENLSRTIVSINQLAEMTSREFQDGVNDMVGDDESTWEKTWVHFEGRIPEVTLQCVNFLRARYPGWKISVECEKPERVGMAEVARLADVVFYSKLWATKNGFENAKSFLECEIRAARDGALLCCTWGAGGATAAKKHHKIEAEWAEAKAWSPVTLDRIDTIVDTIGAGDTFIAGMLYTLNKAEDSRALQQQVEFANEVAGRKVRQEGFADLGRKMTRHQ